MTIPKEFANIWELARATRLHYGGIIIERADGTRPPSRFAKLVGSAGRGPSTDEIMAMLRGKDS